VKILVLIPAPPPEPSALWLESFRTHLMQLRPGMPHGNSRRCALLAYPGTWLLDAEEAAELWLAAIEASVHERLQKGP
jgi:hypothetical protein